MTLQPVDGQARTFAPAALLIYQVVKLICGDGWLGGKSVEVAVGSGGGAGRLLLGWIKVAVTIMICGAAVGVTMLLDVVLRLQDAMAVPTNIRMSKANLPRFVFMFPLL